MQGVRKSSVRRTHKLQWLRIASTEMAANSEYRFVQGSHVLQKGAFLQQRTFLHQFLYSFCYFSCRVASFAFCCHFACICKVFPHFEGDLHMGDVYVKRGRGEGGGPDPFDGSQKYFEKKRSLVLVVAIHLIIQFGHLLIFLVHLQTSYRDLLQQSIFFSYIFFSEPLPFSFSLLQSESSLHRALLLVWRLHGPLANLTALT